MSTRPFEGELAGAKENSESERPEVGLSADFFDSLDRYDTYFSDEAQRQEYVRLRQMVENMTYSHTLRLLRDLSDESIRERLDKRHDQLASMCNMLGKVLQRNRLRVPWVDTQGTELRTAAERQMLKLIATAHALRQATTAGPEAMAQAGVDKHVVQDVRDLLKQLEGLPEPVHKDFEQLAKDPQTLEGRLNTLREQLAIKPSERADG